MASKKIDKTAPERMIRMREKMKEKGVPYPASVNLQIVTAVIHAYRAGAITEDAANSIIQAASQKLADMGYDPEASEKFVRARFTPDK